MAKEKDGPKAPLTIRVDPASLQRLKDKATEEDKTVSTLVNTAIASYLSGGEVEAVTDFYLSEKDLQMMCGIVSAFEQPIPHSLFLEILKARRSGKKPE